MSVAHKIEQLQGYPENTSEEFRLQLEKGRAARAQMGKLKPQEQGIDRSGELLPMPRPRIVRTLAD